MRLTRPVAGLSLLVTALVAIAGAAAGTRGEARPSATKATTITFWNAYSPPEASQIEKVVIPAFERTHPNIKVQNVTIPYDSLRQKLLAATAGGELPDVLRSDIIWVPEFAQLGVYVRLDRQLRDFRKLAKLMFPGPLSTNRWKGGYYGLPLDTNTRVLMYNRAALAKAGLRSPPKTFADMRRMGRKLKAKGVAVFGEGGTGGWNVLPWIWSNGGNLTNAKITKATGYLNSAKSVAAIKLLVDLHRQGAARFVNLDGGLGTSDGLAKGRYGTILDGPWMFPIFAGQYPDFRLRTGRVPRGAGGSVSVVGGEDIVMTTTSKNKAQAATFIRFMLAPLAQTEMAKVGQMPVRKDLKARLTKIHSYYGIFLDQLRNARARTPHPQWPRIDKILETQVAKAIRGQQTPKQALTDAARQIDKLLAQR